MGLICHLPVFCPLLSTGQFAKLSAIFFSLLSSKYYYNLEESLELILVIIYISVTMHLVAPECMWQCCFFLLLTHVGMSWNLSESVLIYGSVVLVPRIPVKPSPFLYFSFVDHQSENGEFSSLGMMTNLLASREKPNPEDKEPDYISGDLSLNSFQSFSLPRITEINNFGWDQNIYSSVWNKTYASIKESNPPAASPQRCPQMCCGNLKCPNPSERHSATG